MTGHFVNNGWERLPNGFDIEFRHAIPVRLSDNGIPSAIPESVLLEEITALGGLHVSLGRWLPGENPNEYEARIYVSDKQLPEVLRRLAVCSATLFVERYHKPIDKEDVDWDALEYVKDLGTALDDCGLDWNDIDRHAYFDDYLETMHRESQRLARQKQSPPVEPE